MPFGLKIFRSKGEKLYEYIKFLQLYFPRLMSLKFHLIFPNGVFNSSQNNFQKIKINNIQY